MRAPHEPAFTVESLAMIATGRPWTRPMPVTTPSAGSSRRRLLARAVLDEVASAGVDEQRDALAAKSLPVSAFFSWYLGAPPS